MILGVCKIAVVHTVIMRHFFKLNGDQSCQKIADDYEHKLIEFGSSHEGERQNSILGMHSYLRFIDERKTPQW